MYPRLLKAARNNFLYLWCNDFPAVKKYFRNKLSTWLTFKITYCEPGIKIENMKTAATESSLNDFNYKSSFTI